ncbi:glycoside hydrolase [Phototrophicus methaneseepsis]|uniref:Glycoside hydrolase n=1 Tax=Phototrophicus methaneseepsis TaxID=2710758 RepID=A0A7S8EBT8_9CHLR|nr:glycoside hydrolase [Phototrophicus methaneseepsis]QPC84039.1 glycoside hydrolase [Phototrophicus methaneseepsis]
MAVKIAIIGGGSAYAPGLLGAFIHKAQDFDGAELALMDIAETELAIVHRLGQKMIEAAHVNLTLTAHTDYRSALADADYVLTTFRQGGFEARAQDERIPLQYGIIGQETIGPGGFFFAMRTIGVVRKLLATIKEVAPRAVLVNYSNPTQIIAEAVTHFSDVPCISICDQSDDDQRKILDALNITPQHVEFESVGLNHATWSTRFLVDGEDGIELMLRGCEDVLARDDISNRLKRQFMMTRDFGRVPNSYMQYYYYRQETVAEAQAAPKSRAQEIMDLIPSYYVHFEEQAAQDVPHVTHSRGGSIFGDMAVEVLRGLVQNNQSIHTLNIPNRAALPDFAPDRVVEVPARLESRNATPLAQHPLPHEVTGLLHMLAEYQWLSAKAIWEGDTRLKELALASNPLVMSVPLARKLLAEIEPLQKQYWG